MGKGAKAVQQVKAAIVDPLLPRTPQQPLNEVNNGQPASPFFNQSPSPPPFMPQTIQPPPLPETQTQSIPAGPAKNKDQVFHNEEGNINGVTIGGKTFLGLGPQDVEGIIKDRNETNKGGPHTQAFEQGVIASQQAEQQAELQQQNVGLAGQVGNAPQLNAFGTPIDQGQAVGAGLVGSVPSILRSVAAGAGGGALIGGVPSAGVGAIPGALIGGGIGLIAGVYNAVKSNIAKQETGSISTKSKQLTDGKKNLNNLVLAAKKDPTHAQDYVNKFNTQLSLIDKAQSELKIDTQRGVFKYLGNDGTTSLEAFENFYETGGLRESLITKMQLTLTSMGSDEFDTSYLDIEDTTSEVIENE